MSTTLTLILAYRYWILLPLAVVEGPIIAVMAGWLISQETLAILPTVTILLLGDLIPDTCYYWIGRTAENKQTFIRYRQRFGITDERLRIVEHLWQTHTYKTALIAKWAYGMSTPILMTAGVAQLSMRKFLTSVVIITVIQYVLLLILGYYFGSAYQLLSVYIKSAGWLVTVFIAVILLLYIGVSRYAKRLLLRIPS